MRNFIPVALAAVAVAACSVNGAASVEAQPVEGTGGAGQRTYAVTGFDRVDLAGPDDVVVTVGGQPSVRAEGDERALDSLEIRQEGSRLWVGVKRGNWPNRGKATIYVTTPWLQRVDVAGSGNMRVGALRAPQFAAAVAGSGNLLLEGLEADAASFDVAGSGNVRAAGRAREAKLQLAGSGSGELGGFQAETADISIVGSGSADLRATGSAAVNIVGSGDVTVSGGARCSVSRIGSGNARCG